VPTAATDQSPVLFVYAHPDDETFGVAGTMALLRQRDVPITLICATRGEAGGISDATLATQETLGQVREAELRAAMDIVGVGDIRLLDYRDSGMEGTPENDDPRCLHQAPEENVAADIAAIIREIRPAVVVTFGPDGIYGHPDHLAIHRAATRAVHLAAAAGSGGGGWQTPRLYYQTSSRERMIARAAHRKGPFTHMSDERIAQLGTPRAEISFALDVSSVVTTKETAMRAHRTQIGPNGPMSELPRDEVLQMLSREHYVRVDLPWPPPADTPDPLHALEQTYGTAPA
jgi:N-acetyl-1-D-myo-inositol-2-amino-2-deoxy-alpha-D-glucopyranoside deacetylase